MKVLKPFTLILGISLSFLLISFTATRWEKVASAEPQHKLNSLTSAPLSIPAGIDLDVTYINRTPMYKAYCVQYPEGIPMLCPGTESDKRWPAPGEIVTFTAHMVNKGTLTSPDFAYKFFIDEIEVAAGMLAGLAPGTESTAAYAWAWAHHMDGERVVDDHTIRFTIDPLNAITETYETNNSLLDRTNALGFRITMTPLMYQTYNTPLNPAFSYSAEDWLQRQIAAMNWAFANSVYTATTGQGATERVRINWIEITSTVPANDFASDGGWFVNGDYRFISGGYDPVTDIDWSLVHELSHQVGLIDLYNLGASVTSVKVTDQDGTPANFGFGWPRSDLMGGGDIAPYTNAHLYSSHSAGGISSTKGYRRGYYGEYQFDLPQQVYVLILDNQGQPVGGAQVNLYQRNADIDNVPEISGLTDLNGRLLLTNRSANGGTTTRTGHMLHDNPFGVVDVVGSKNIFLLKLARGEHEEFHWLDITNVNLAYWQGHTLSHTLTISSHLPAPNAPSAPRKIEVETQGNNAILCWQASSSNGVNNYRLYRAAAPMYAYVPIGGLLNTLCYTDAYADSNRIYAVTAIDENGQESGFSRFIWVPRLLNPLAVAVPSDGTRVILDPQNGYALLRQRSDGHYVQNFGSEHYHLELSRFLAIDEQDRIIFSHPGDFYSGRHSVRVADKDANPILEFGERGSDIGQFETPTGVGVWGQSCQLVGPYDVDAHTLLLLHFDNSYTGAQGEIASANGMNFTNGKYAQAVAVNASDTLTYASAGNLLRTQGTIEFWIRPYWNGNDNQPYTFFEVGNTWFNRLRIMKDGANNLRFMLWNSTTEYGVAYNITNWQAGEWHHVAATWTGTNIDLYVDGEQRANNTANPPDSLADTLYIGSSAGLAQQANADIDEIRISDIPRVGNSDTCGYHILVADSGNNRVQAFDGQGNFIAAYGSAGSGLGQFNNPQGLAIDHNGNVVVADSGNNRLQLLSFNGSNFGFIQSITASVNNPTGVAAYGTDRILVADTGNNKIKVLDSQGNLLAEYTAPNDGHVGAFNQPQGVIADKHARIVVADTVNKRVVTIVGALPVLPVVDVSVTGAITGSSQIGYTFIAASGPMTATWPITYTWQTTEHPPVIHTSNLMDTINFSWNVTGPTPITLTATNAGGTVIVTHVITITPSYKTYLPFVQRNTP